MKDFIKYSDLLDKDPLICPIDSSICIKQLTILSHTNYLFFSLLIPLRRTSHCRACEHHITKNILITYTHHQKQPICITLIIYKTSVSKLKIMFQIIGCGIGSYFVAVCGAIYKRELGLFHFGFVCIYICICICICICYSCSILKENFGCIEKEVHGGGG